MSDLEETHRAARDRATSDRAFASWIGGDHHHAETGEMVETIDPATGERITQVPACGEADVHLAVQAAQSAMDGPWGETTPADRSRALFEWADVLHDHEDELTLLECLDTGKPKTDARGEVQGAIDTLEYYASLARSQDGAQIPASHDVHLYTRHEPFGVVGQIVPWNFPTWAAGWKFGPALAAGNATVLKPSVNTPLSAIRMAQLADGILPDGVINVVTGTGSEVGAALTEHAGVAKISFTGSTDVGKRVMQSGAEHFAPVTLELGGKSPFLVFPDADLEKAVSAVAAGVFYATGQICDALSRAIVHEDIHDAFVERLVAVAEEYTVGDPLEAETDMGPLTTAEQYETVTRYVEIGQQEDGATLVTGGDKPDGDMFDDGWFVSPTVFDDVTNDMRIAREEIFGPVASVLTFETYDEAIELANDTRFGLAAGIGTERTSLVHHAAADLEAGLIYVNEYGPILPEAPYGGFKDSGIGRDLGKEALDHYRQTKSVYVNLDEPELS